MAKKTAKKIFRKVSTPKVSAKGIVEVVLSAKNKEWEPNELLYIKHDYREYIFVEKTDKGIWCRPYSAGKPSNMLHVSFDDVLFAKPEALKSA